MVYELLPPLHAEYCEVFLNTGKTRIYGRHGGSIHLQIVRCIVQYSTLKNRPLHKKFSWKTLTSKRLGGKGGGICLAWWLASNVFVKYCIRWFIYIRIWKIDETTETSLDKNTRRILSTKDRISWEHLFKLIYTGFLKGFMDFSVFIFKRLDFWSCKLISIV